LFFGTPHLGMDVENLMSLLPTDHPRRVLLQSISHNEPNLEDRLQEFKDISIFKIVTYYETLLTSQVTIVSVVELNAIDDWPNTFLHRIRTQENGVEMVPWCKQLIGDTHLCSYRPPRKCLYQSIAIIQILSSLTHPST